MCINQALMYMIITLSSFHPTTAGWKYMLYSIHLMLLEFLFIFLFISVLFLPTPTCLGIKGLVVVVVAFSSCCFFSEVVL
jgi:hypothetical protein